MASDLISRHCIPCKGGVSPLERDAIAPLLAQLSGWSVVDEEGAPHHLRRALVFRDFVTALAFVNAIGAVAESEGHHPDLFLTWGKVNVEIHTHSINGLTESDFVLAAKIDELPRDGAL